LMPRAMVRVLELWESDGQVDGRACRTSNAF